LSIFIQGTPAHNTLHCQVGLASGRSLGRDWRRRPGRPRARWTDQLRNDTGSVPANLWRQTGHPTGSWWSDAAARAGYAMTTTTTSFWSYNNLYDTVIWYSEWPVHFSPCVSCWWSNLAFQKLLGLFYQPANSNKCWRACLLFDIVKLSVCIALLYW